VFFTHFILYNIDMFLSEFIVTHFGDGRVYG